MEQTERDSGFGEFVAEMRRRHVVRIALGYAAAAFVVLQLAEIVFPAFGIGEGGLRVLVVLTALGFLPAVVLAWVYDITTEGIRRTNAPSEADNRSRLAAGALLVTTLIVTGGLGLYLANQGVFEALAGDDAPAAPIPPVAYDPSVPIRSLAVLPLQDFSPTGDQAYFTSGMHEELIAKLSMLEGVRVVSRTTVMRYSGTTMTAPEIGRELGVDVLVEGSVSRSENRVRITLQIIHAPSDSHIRTLQWDREDVADVLGLQTEVAHAVVHEMNSTHEESTYTAASDVSVAPEAQEAFMRARHEYDRGTADGYGMALEYFQEALDADPEFAAAMAGKAGARFLVGLEDPEANRDQLQLAREEALAALDLDSTSMEAKEVLSFIERGFPHIGGAVLVSEPLGASDVRVVTMPGTFDSIAVDVAAFDTAWVDALTGLGARLEEQMRRRSYGPDRAAGRVGRQEWEARRLMSSGQFGRAVDILDDLVTEAPDMESAWDMLARAHVEKGDAAGAASVVARWSESGVANAPDQSWVLRLRDAVEFQGAQGYWAWELDRLTAADDEGGDVPRMELAAAHAALHNTDEAFRFLVEALERGEPGVLSIRSDPVWDDLRGDPRFRALARQAQEMRFSPSRRPRGSGGPDRR